MTDPMTDFDEAIVPVTDTRVMSPSPEPAATPVPRTTNESDEVAGRGDCRSSVGEKQTGYRPVQAGRGLDGTEI